MILGELSPGQLSERLAGTGLRVRIGEFAVCIRSPIESVRDGIALHYVNHEVSEASEFADFRVTVTPSKGLRRWINATATFHMSGASPFPPLPASQAFPLFEWGLNWCVAMHCHQFLILHAAVLERANRALVLPAPPGSGKSTLCAALASRGWRLLSDELAIIDTRQGKLLPLPRPISLKNESIPLIQRFWHGAVMSPVVHDTMKGSVAHLRVPASSIRLAKAAAAPGWIVVPRYVRGETANLTPLGCAAGLMRLIENAFNYSMHGRRGFEVLADLADASECLEFTYGGDLEAAVHAFDSLAFDA